MKKFLYVLLSVVLFVSVTVLISACGEEVHNYYGDLSQVGDDTDGDGLSDSNERDVYGTSPVLADTDGDGLSDFMEIIEYGFDPTNTRYKYNPLIADIPKFAFTLTSPPSVSLHLTDTEGKSNSFETTRTTETATTTSQSRSGSFMYKAEVTVGTEAEGSLFGPKATVSASVTAGYESTVSYSKEQSEENRNALSRAEAYEKSTEVAASGGKLMVTGEIENKGNVAFRVETLIMSAVEPLLNTDGPPVLNPVGNLTLDAYDSFPPVSIAPGEKIGVLNFSNDALDLESAKSLLRNTRSITIKPASYELTDAQGNPFAFSLEGVQAKTATVTIDYADKRQQEIYSVAMNADPDNPGLSVGEVMGDILAIPYMANTVIWNGVSTSGLVGIRNDPALDADFSESRRWAVVHVYPNGIDTAAVLYDMNTSGYDFDGIQLKAGHFLYIFLMEDEDGDTLYAREEFLLGTGIGNTDSDGDGIDDIAEFTNTPATDPANPDTDYDGLGDLDDPEPATYNTYMSGTGEDNSFMIKTNGTLWIWGSNHNGKLGVGNNTGPDICTGQPCANAPLQVGTDTDWKQLSIGWTHVLAAKESGTLWAWGLNDYGQLGIGNYTDKYSPVKVGADYDWRITEASNHFSMGLRENGMLWTWGLNYFGSLGTGDVLNSVVPTLIGESGDRFIKVSSFHRYSLAIKSDGTLWAWGNNSRGQLGVGNKTGPDDCNGDPCANAPVQVGTDNDWADVATAAYTSYALKANGTLYAWGYNNNGELGDGTTYLIYSPRAIGTGWKKISAGDAHVHGIRTNGTLWAWGLNDRGQLGIGTDSGPDNCGGKSCAKTPQQVGSDNDWARVSGGGNHTVALKKDGTVWAWGHNHIGQVGDGIPGGWVTAPECISSVLPSGTCP